MSNLVDQYSNVILGKEDVNQEAVRLWLQALRSGDYEQGRSYLNRDGQYCCLGVLCEIAASNGITLEKSATGMGAIMYAAAEGDASMQLLPMAVAKWLGFNVDTNFYWNNPVVWTDYGNATQSLAALNDSVVSFNDIADIIERNWIIEPEQS